MGSARQNDLLPSSLRLMHTDLSFNLSQTNIPQYLSKNLNALLDNFYFRNGFPHFYCGMDNFTECSLGKYGKGCTSTCNATCGGPDNLCDISDGRCTAGCDNGFQGPSCDQGRPYCCYQTITHTLSFLYGAVHIESCTSFRAHRPPPLTHHHPPPPEPHPQFAISLPYIFCL